MKLRHVSFALVLVLAGCQTVQERFDQQRAPTRSEKASIIEGARIILRDPYSIRDAEISNYVPADAKSGHICVRANAKNAMGGYTGKKGWLIAIVNNRAVNGYEGHPMCNLAQMRYQPFPEIYRLREL